MTGIFYLCNQKKECRQSTSCRDLCFHTSDPEYALNGPTMDPQTDNRFEKVDSFYVEKRMEDEYAAQQTGNS